MSEPIAKKSKISPNDSTFIFAKGTRQCDRDLLVANNIYHVDSETLIEHSEYFRVMFTSNFMEKKRTEIELKEVEEKELRIFLNVVFDPEGTVVKEEVLSMMFRVFVYFIATDFLIKFLNSKKVFTRFDAKYLLELSHQHVIPEVTENVEKCLIEKFSKQFPKKDELGDHHEFDIFIYECLDLANEFELRKLKRTIETHLSNEYKKSSHRDSVEEKYAKLTAKYELEFLNAEVELYAISQFESNPGKAEEIFARYVCSKSTVVMKELKALIECRFINTLSEMDSRGNTLWDTIANFILTHKNYNAEYRKTMAVLKLRLYLLYSNNYDLHNLKAVIEKILVDGLAVLAVDNQQNHLELVSTIMEIAQFSNNVKNTVEHYFLEKVKCFDELDEEFLEALFDCSAKYNMQELKNKLEGRLITEFQNSYSFKSIKFAFIDRDGFFFQKFRDTVTDFLKTISLEDQIMKANRKHILELSTEHSRLILEALLRVPDEQA